MGDPSPLAARNTLGDAAARGRDERLRGAIALLAVGLAAGGAGELSYEQLKQRFRGAMTRDPVDSLAAMVLGCSYLFYLAEHEENPRCARFVDAVLFISTCLSVGYADVFARTDAGKAIASFVMTFGPTLAASALSGPAPQETQDQNRAVLERLDGILEALRAPR
ncbi:ion channel [Sorangium sp. So ce269]